MEGLQNKLENMNSSEPGLISMLMKKFIPRTFEKGLLLSTPEHSLPFIYYIEHGLVRGYFLSGAEQQTAWIMESGFILPPGGFLKKQASAEYIGILEKSEGFALSLTAVPEIAEKNPHVYQLLLEIYDEILFEARERARMLRISHAAERYIYFRTHYPRLAYQPIHDILASLLNIEPKYLYRIKRLYR